VRCVSIQPSCTRKRSVSNQGDGCLTFGVCPRPVFEIDQTWQRTLERQPVAFLGRQAAALLAHARSQLAAYNGQKFLRVSLQGNTRRVTRLPWLRRWSGRSRLLPCALHPSLRRLAKACRRPDRTPGVDISKALIPLLCQRLRDVTI
jgi:hypothetical protein